MLDTVTITGADDSTSIPALVDLSAEFKFVEWGILISKSQEGGKRFPSRHWIDRFASAARRNGMRVSTHMCGRWVREMFVAQLDWRELPSSVEFCHRIQINTHGQVHESTADFVQNLAEHTVPFGGQQIIFQWDGVNDHLIYAALAAGLNVAALFDASGGAGVLPKEWVPPAKEFPCGYAGGLGPHNVVDNIRKIEKLCDKPFWIDMERRVRVPDDSSLDMEAVRTVLERSAGVRATPNA
jgi:hypothetical protein